MLCKFILIFLLYSDQIFSWGVGQNSQMAEANFPTPRSKKPRIIGLKSFSIVNNICSEIEIITNVLFL